MKKILFLLGTLMCICQTVPASAADLKDNNLKLDSRRIEQEEEQAFYQQSEILASLFSEADTKKLAEVKDSQAEALDSQAGQLFTKEREATDIYQLDQLFAEGDANRYATKLDTAQTAGQAKGGMAGYFYSAVCLLLVGGAGLASFLAGRKDELPD